ncbi:hypothetical protein [Methylobacterium sp. P1-11]|uniref:hypothetical protein n=1 Tax=Methylobacterium sp. P1-11 TaxID=2024616 RepID=UPI0015646B4E|nr:hypothetical protein [Methylobacterium sp. P1-11]
MAEPAANGLSIRVGLDPADQTVSPADLAERRNFPVPGHRCGRVPDPEQQIETVRDLAASVFRAL